MNRYILVIINATKVGTVLVAVVFGTSIMAHANLDDLKLKTTLESQQRVWSTSSMDLRVRVYAVAPGKYIDPAPLTAAEVQLTADVMIEMRRPNADRLIAEIFEGMLPLNFEESLPLEIGVVVRIDGPWDKNVFQMAISRSREYIYYGGKRAKISDAMNKTLSKQIYRRIDGALGIQ